MSVKESVAHLIALETPNAGIARALRNTGADIYDVAQEMRRAGKEVTVSDADGVPKLIIDPVRSEGGDVVVWEPPNTYRGITSPLPIYAARFEVAIGAMEVAAAFFEWLGYKELLVLRQKTENEITRVFETQGFLFTLIEPTRISRSYVGESVLIFSGSNVIESFVDFKIDLTEWLKKKNIRINNVVIEKNVMMVTISTVFLFRIAFVKAT